MRFYIEKPYVFVFKIQTSKRVYISACADASIFVPYPANIIDFVTHHWELLIVLQTR